MGSKLDKNQTSMVKLERVTNKLPGGGAFPMLQARVKALSLVNIHQLFVNIKMAGKLA